MMIKTPISLSSVGLVFKIISWVIIVQALGMLKAKEDPGFVVFLELLGIALFIAAGKLQNVKEWARLLFWGFSLFMGIYFIFAYIFQAFTPGRSGHPERLQLLLGVGFIWLFGYLNQPRIKHLFRLKSVRKRH